MLLAAINTIALYGLLIHLVSSIPTVLATELETTPEHEFIFEKQKFTKGKKEKKTFLKLIIEPHTYSLKSKAK